MNDREREICARVKEFREAIKWPQKDFAAQIGITLNKLASIEYGRTPLRYEIAWKIRHIFDLSLHSLWSKDWSPDELEVDCDLPHFGSAVIRDCPLLTDVFKHLYKLSSEDTEANSKGKKNDSLVKIDDLEAHRRWLARLRLTLELDDFLALVPNECLPDFSEVIIERMRIYTSVFPEESAAVIKARRSALYWEIKRADIARKFITPDRNQKKDLTNVSVYGNIEGVKPKLPALLQRIKKATEPRGKKTQLAKFLDVPLSKVSQWLAGENEPGGETTLRLLHWVEQQERQK